jgi:hypothetical protein
MKTNPEVNITDIIGRWGVGAFFVPDRANRVVAAGFHRDPFAPSCGRYRPVDLPAVRSITEAD